MKIFGVIAIALIVVGCATTHRSASLSAEQAKAVALRLANEKACALYNCQPFRDGQPARFASGHWVWTDRQGFGSGELEVTVELGADGRTNNVDLDLLVIENLF